jgi:hypothetical protein
VPLIVTVGLIRKRSENYQSDGASISLTAELDQSLLARPEALQAQIDSLYEQADTALAFRSLPSVPPQRHYPTDVQPQPGLCGPIAVGNGAGGEARTGAAAKNVGSNGNAKGVCRMTKSQRRAISVIASAMGIDPHREARDVVGVELDQLSIRQASQLIDHLKALSST